MLKTNIVKNMDCLEGLKELPDGCVDLIATDPPYGIGVMSKYWDEFNEVVFPGGVFGNLKGFNKLPRNNAGCMREFFVPIWKECFRVLKPGAFAFVMCASRSDVMHEQIGALKEVGFKVGFTPLYWAYANGFPKNHNVAKGLLKQGFDAEHLRGCYAGYRPKPAVEIIIVAMKPLSEKTYAEQAIKNGKGVTWLDDCRIPLSPGETLNSGRPSIGNSPFPNDHALAGGAWGDANLQRGFIPNEKGRYPCNFVVSDNCLGDFSKFFDLDRWDAEQEVKDCFPVLVVKKPSQKEKSGNKHPTKKPVKLFRYLVQLGSREADLVLDPFGGSGTTGVACQQLNRQFLLFENEKQYCEIAERRLMQKSLLGDSYD